MRLKQLLGVLLSLLVLSAMAAAGTHLTAVQAQPQGAGTTITIQASGPFTHTEYRPADDSLLVDLAGVNAGQVATRLHDLNLPGVASYAVTSFQGASGAEVTRVEFHLKGAPSVSLADGANALTVNVTAAGDAPAAPANTAESIASAAPASTKAVAIEHIGVVHGADGSALEVRGSGVMTGKVLRLTAPDRLVLDVPNTVLATRTRNILVGAADVKAVRVARYQVSPPVTRIVLDLKGQHDWELTPAGSKLVLKMRPAAAAAAAAGQKPAPAAVAEAAPAKDPAQDFVVVQPVFQPKAENTETAAAQPPAGPVARATEAAAKFTPATSASDIPLAAGVVPMANAAMTPQAQAAPMPAVNPAAQPQQSAGSAAKRFSGEPISLNLKDADVVDFFRLVHEISGLNVVLDPNVKGRITLVLDDVPWDQALDIVLKNNGLDMQLEGNVLRIATVDTLRREAEARRAQAEAQALAADKVTVTRFPSYAHSKDVAPTIKKLLSQRGDVFSDDRTNALIIQDIPAVFPAIDRLLTQLDRKTQEVEIEARVVAATRNFARDIGTQMGFGWGNGVNTSVGGAASGITPTNIDLGTGAIPQYRTVGTGQIPFFSNFGATAPTSGLALVNATRTYRLDFYLTMAESRGLLKILSRPRVVTQNNIQALIKQGARIPIVTSAQLGGPATTTYVDAFLRLTVTPQITAESTIFLNIDVENTVPDFGHVNNLGNPTLITQQATTQVLVTDGGTVVIGGVIQTQNSVSVFQVPLLGNIPVLGNLFKRRSVSSQTQELIFFITPKIIQT